MCMITTPCLCVVCAGVGVGVGAGVGVQACVHDYNSLLVCCVRRLPNWQHALKTPKWVCQLVGPLPPFHWPCTTTTSHWRWVHAYLCVCVCVCVQMCVCV